MCARGTCWPGSTQRVTGCVWFDATSVAGGSGGKVWFNNSFCGFQLALNRSVSEREAASVKQMLWKLLREF